jgi:prepilin-type N-terminal cleavage/methylation domain-containing protein/prepilin-type processing-associated H-X9-DG protein
MSKRSGFTLIELLVVIAIIAILAAILFPVFARARAKAQQNNCLSNIKQMSLAVISYVADYDDYYCPSWYIGPTRNYHWDTSIYPYVLNAQIFSCPAGNNVATWGGATGYMPAPALVNADYGMNPSLGQQGCGCGGATPANISVWPPLKQANVLNVSQMVMLFATSTSGGYGFYNPDVTGKTSNIESRHNTGGNVSYCDGHAKWLSSSVLLDTTTPNVNMWNNVP